MRKEKSIEKKLISIFYKSLLCAILATVILWMIISYIFVFSNRTIDSDLPQYMIYEVENYIKLEDGVISVNNELFSRMEKHNIWLQILDEDGSEIFSKNVPMDLPNRYTRYEMLNICLNSNRLGNYTVYATELTQKEDYGVLLGCNSELVQKRTYSYLGNGQDEIMKTILVFIVVAIVVVVIVSIAFMKYISKPIAQLVRRVHYTTVEEKANETCNKGLFYDVFQELELLEKRIKRGKQLRTEWIINISHDIKTPLTTIKGYAELLAESDYLYTEQEVKKYSKFIQKSAYAIEELIEDLRFSEKLSDGSFKLQKTNINLVLLIQECIDGIDDKTKNEGSISFIYYEDVYLSCDAKVLKRVLNNIIENAFIHNNSKIEVVIRLVKNEHVIIEIEDNGKGLSQGEMERIFERYYRGTNSKDVKGTGLGMAIAKEGIEIHGGTVGVFSVEGGGTKFTIKL